MVTEKTEKVEKFLEEHGIDFTTHHHPPLPTIELALEYWKEIDATHCKNLFFRNHKGNRHYLVVFECHKELGVHALEKSLRQGKLSFASQERMERCLGLLPGSVSPFGLINDMNLTDSDGIPAEGVSAKELFENGHRVKLFLDKDLQNAEKISFHPCDNTASTVISNAGLLKFLNIWGGEYEWIDVREEPLLSLIIPAYNAENHLERCLESCVHQDLPAHRYEMIVINDGSSDNTLEIARRWETGHPNIKVISQTNQGLSMARNAGIDAASGKYIMFIDSDDHIVPDCLAGLAEKCRKDSPDILRICAADVRDGSVIRRFSLKDGETCSGKDILRQKFQVCAPFSIYRKGFLEQNRLRFHPGIYHEDNEFTPRAYYLAENAISCNDLIYMVMPTPQSITRTPNVKRGYDLLKIIGMLTDFARTQVEELYRPYIYRQVSDCINRCIRLLDALPPQDRDALYAEIYENREIFRLMKESSALTHRIEGFLLCMFPKRMACIYNLLDRMRH